MSLSLAKISGPKKASISNFVETHGVGYSISTAVKYGLLVIMSLIIILPILVIFFGAFKTGTEFNSTGAFDLPKVWQFKNFLTVWEKGDMGRAFLNTIIMIGLTCAGSIMTGTMASYVLHRFDFKGKKLIKNLFLWIDNIYLLQILLSPIPFLPYNNLPELHCVMYLLSINTFLFLRLLNLKIY